MRQLLFSLFLLPLVPGVLGAGQAVGYTVSTDQIADDKAVFATVESRDTVAARVRTAGTISQINVKEGDLVSQGQVIATITDQKLVLQKGALDATIAALSASLDQAGSDLARAENLIKSGATTQARLDELRTTATVAAKTLEARRAERAVLEQQLAEGAVLAPTNGRVLSVPVTAGTVVMSGETVATIADRDLVLRLRLPESHAGLLHVGDSLRLASENLAGEEPGAAGPHFGTITLVYPEIRDGRVVADAHVTGLGDYFVGERVRVWITGGRRPAIVVPAGLLTSRFGLDYARLRQADGSTLAVPVQRGQPHPRPDLPDGVEILSGLRVGDELVAP